MNEATGHRPTIVPCSTSMAFRGPQQKGGTVHRPTRTAECGLYSQPCAAAHVKRACDGLPLGTPD